MRAPKVAAILLAFGAPHRRVIFDRLRRRPQSVGELAQGLSITRSAVSRHLGVLRDCGLVDAEAEGVRRIYRALPEGLEPLKAWICAPPSPRRPKRLY